MGGFGLLGILILGGLGLLAPQMLPVLVYKLGVIATAAVLGYWVDRQLFPYARPHTLINPQLQTAFGTATLRRAIIVSAAMVALALAI